MEFRINRSNNSNSKDNDNLLIEKDFQRYADGESRSQNTRWRGFEKLHDLQSEVVQTEAVQFKVVYS